MLNPWANPAVLPVRNPRSHACRSRRWLDVQTYGQNFPTESSMTLLGNFVEMSGQEEQDPFKWNKRSGRSMRGKNQRLHQEGMGSRTASHAVHTPPIHPLFSLFSCPYKISQQSHLSCTSPIDRPWFSSTPFQCPTNVG